MIVDLKPYPAYKDSGVPWLGEVPEHWEVLPNRALFAEINERDHPEEQMLSVTITQGVIHQRALLADSSKRDSSNQDKSAYKLVQPGDIAYNKMRAWQGAIGASQYRGIVSPAYVVQRPRQGIEPRYFHYLFRTPAFAKEAERWSYGITSDMWSLRPEHFKMIYSCLPPLPEQSAIVRFLDHYDQKIRRYILAKQKLIKLLEEQKQAIIHRAVTRGLDPNVRLKPSSVEWLGDVPEHWEVLSLGVAVESIQTGPFGSQIHANEYVTGGIPVINPSHMRDGCIEPDPKVTVSQRKAQELIRHELWAGDIVAARRGELGRCALIRDSETGWLCGTGSLRIRPNARVFAPEYLLLVFGSYGVRDTLSLSSIGATMDNLNAGMVARLRLPCPPLSEQRLIVDTVASRAVSTQSASNVAHREISLLREYRTRLIADVVTGKLDVSGIELPELEEAGVLEEVDGEVTAEDMNPDAESGDEDTAEEEGRA